MSIFSWCFRVSDMMGKYLVCFMTLDSLTFLANLSSYLAWILQISQPFFPEGDGFLDVCVVLIFATLFFWLFFSICFRKDVEEDFISLTIFDLQLWWGDEVFGSCRLAHWFFRRTCFFLFCMIFYVLHSQYPSQWWLFWLEKLFFFKDGEFVEIWVTLWFSSLCFWCFTVIWIWRDVENSIFSRCFRLSDLMGNSSLFHDAWLLDFSGKPVFLSRMSFTDLNAVLF